MANEETEFPRGERLLEFHFCAGVPAEVEERFQFFSYRREKRHVTAESRITACVRERECVWSASTKCSGVICGSDRRPTPAACYYC